MTGIARTYTKGFKNLSRSLGLTLSVCPRIQRSGFGVTNVKTYSTESTESKQTSSSSRSQYNSNPAQQCSNRVELDYDIRSLRKRKEPLYPKDSLEASILEASLAFVPEYGFSVQAIHEACKMLGYSDVTHGLFERGEIELIEYFIKKSTVELEEQVYSAHPEFQSYGMTKKVHACVETRLKMLEPFIRQWPEAIALMAQPNNVPTGLANLHDLIDEIWAISGEQSFDMNYYSRRTLLSGVYLSTEWYMTQDKSPEFEQTYKFLDARLKDTASIGKAAQQVKQMSEFAIRSGLGIIKSVRNLS